MNEPTATRTQAANLGRKLDKILAALDAFTNLPIVQRANLEPDDIVVVSLTARLSAETYDRVAEKIKEAVPGHRVLILDDGAGLHILKPHQVDPSIDRGTREP